MWLWLSLALAAPLAERAVQEVRVPGGPVRAAALGPDGTLWVLRGGGSPSLDGVRGGKSVAHLTLKHEGKGGFVGISVQGDMAWLLRTPASGENASLLGVNLRPEVRGGAFGYVELKVPLTGKVPTGLSITEDAAWLAWDVPGGAPGLTRLPWTGTMAGSLSAGPGAEYPAGGPRGERVSGLTRATVDGASYLIVKAADRAYVADARAGRLLFELPAKAISEGAVLVGAADSLLSVQSTKGGMVVRTLDLSDDAPSLGPVRGLDVSLELCSSPERGAASAGGRMTHELSLPPDDERQRWGGRFQVSAPGSLNHKQIQVGTLLAPQRIVEVNWPAAKSGVRCSTLSFPATTRFEQPYVYPHRVDGALPSFPRERPAEMYGPESAARAFVRRVAAFWAEQHHLSAPEAEAELKQAYWAGRAVASYIQANYRYPDPSRGMGQVEDLPRGHNAGGPASAKFALSAGASNADARVACDSASVMSDAALRELGFAARWVGTSHLTDQSALPGAAPGVKWDANNNGVLDVGEAGVALHGHRYTELYLGERYGWQMVDATPAVVVKEVGAFTPQPSSPWRVAGDVYGLTEQYRLVLSRGVGRVDELWRQLEDPRAGGYQAYSVASQEERPVEWAHPKASFTFRGRALAAGESESK